MRFASIEYKEYKEQSSILNEKLTDSKLSPFSLEIMNFVLQKKNLVLFSQGPLNLTPLLAASYSIKHEADVAVFLPERDFEKRYRNYSRTFFSLLYRPFLNPLHSKYFYYDIMWCKGILNGDDSELTTLEIESKPLHGERNFRTSYEKYLTENFQNGKILTSKEITVVKKGRILPTNLLGQKEILFKDLKSPLEFQPKLFILESLNESYSQLDVISKLIDTLNIRKTQFVLHFSWPYLRGIAYFLERLKAKNTEVKIIHLGKRICFELGKSFERPEAPFEKLSLEGKIWERQYNPLVRSSETVILVPKMKSFNFTNEAELASFHDEIDEDLQDIAQYLSKYPANFFVEECVKYPACLNSFVSPEEIKDYDRKINMNIALETIVQNQLGDSHYVTRIFKGINDSMRKTRNLITEFSATSTFSRISKKTLLQTAIIHNLNDIMDSNSGKPRNLILVDLHQGLNTASGLKRDLVSLVAAIFNLKRSIKYPIPQKVKQSVEISLPSGSYKVYENGCIDTNVGERLKEYFRTQINHNIPVVPNIDSTPEYLITEVRLDESVPYFEVYGDNQEKKIKSANHEGLLLFRLTVTLDGRYETLKLEDIYCEQNTSSRQTSIISKWSINKNNENSKVETRLDIYYVKLSRLRYLDNDSIMEATLLLPGPIPRTSVSNQQLILSEGYDILLMPFKRIIFLSYPGKNYSELQNQLRVYDELFSAEVSPIAYKDIEFSRKYSTFSSLVVPQLPAPDRIDSNIPSQEFDDIVREEELMNENDSKSDNEQKRLMEIIEKIKMSPNHAYAEGRPQEEDDTSQNLATLQVRFEDGSTEELKFRIGTFLRKKINDEFLLTRVEEIEPDDEIIYIESDSKMTIDDYILSKFGQDDQITMERILEPLTCLSVFCKEFLAVSKGITKFEKLYWLKERQRKTMFDFANSIIKGLDIGPFFSRFISDNIWANFISVDEVRKIFLQSEKRITIEHFYKLAQKAGLTLMDSTFSMYCNFRASDAKHYFFRDETNLLAIALLIGNGNMVENYKKINESGEDIVTLLQLIGRTISRITTGNLNPLNNEMDSVIENAMRVCKVLTIRQNTS